jgi:hypothetical protein
MGQREISASRQKTATFCKRCKRPIHFYETCYGGEYYQWCRSCINEFAKERNVPFFVAISYVQKIDRKIKTAVQNKKHRKTK